MHTLIAQSINLAHETISREIEKLEDDNLLAREHNHIVIKGVKALAGRFSEPVSLNLWGLDSLD